MKNQNQSEWLQDYNQFLSFEQTRVPEDLSHQVLKKMDSLLHPKAVAIFAKISGLHLIVGFLSMAVCHQFGMNPFETSFSLADVFMRWGGHGVCMIFCGFLFMGLSLAIAGGFLSIEEIQALRRTEFPQALGLSIISLSLFFLAGAEMAVTFTGLWLLGALIGGFLVTEATWYLRKAMA